MTAKEAMDIGMKIAADHQVAVLEMLKHFPDLTPEKALHGNSVWLGTQIMKALCDAEQPMREALEAARPYVLDADYSPHGKAALAEVDAALGSVEQSEDKS
jgi:fructose-specific component phosphotransferase system IIB-like protein